MPVFFQKHYYCHKIKSQQIKVWSNWLLFLIHEADSFHPTKLNESSHCTRAGQWVLLGTRKQYKKSWLVYITLLYLLRVKTEEISLSYYLGYTGISCFQKSVYGDPSASQVSADEGALSALQFPSGLWGPFLFRAHKQAHIPLWLCTFSVTNKKQPQVPQPGDTVLPPVCMDAAVLTRHDSVYCTQVPQTALPNPAHASFPMYPPNPCESLRKKLLG